jgi:clan AA aspartic protease (TIGR02281 family)
LVFRPLKSGHGNILGLKIRALSALGALLCAAGLFAFAADPPGCKLTRLVEWPVQFQWGLPIIEGAINGKKIGVLVDTGAYASILTKAAAERLGVYASGTRDYLYGTGGESRMFVAKLDELRVGSMARKDIRVRVGGERELPGIDFILGTTSSRSSRSSSTTPERSSAFSVRGIARATRWLTGIAMPRGAARGQRAAVPVPEDQWPGRAGPAGHGRLDFAGGAFLCAKVGITPQTPGVVPSDAPGESGPISCATG